MDIQAHIHIPTLHYYIFNRNEEAATPTDQFRQP